MIDNKNYFSPVNSITDIFYKNNGLPQQETARTSTILMKPVHYFFSDSEIASEIPLSAVLKKAGPASRYTFSNFFVEENLACIIPLTTFPAIKAVGEYIPASFKSLTKAAYGILYYTFHDIKSWVIMSWVLPLQEFLYLL
ncbi:hypothetical protein AOB46_02005 [Chryseobacterium indologenes]|uniref:Uncharacterized protein n=1 Tax=Chryseobacterium indologenes TaxID=253 RepID=A0A0N0IY50_CHRID|nr:hypothetical protein AOB46_02005 [Chryseobacterium indologenes]